MRTALLTKLYYGRILAEFVQRSDGRAHATYILTGFIKNGAPGASGQSMHSFGSAPSGLLTSSNESGVNGAGNGDVAMSGGNEDEGIPSSSAPQAGPSSQAYVTELKTQEERPIDQVECIMLVPQEELQGADPVHGCAEVLRAYLLWRLAEKAALFSTILSQDVYSAEPTRLPVSTSSHRIAPLLAG